MHYQLIEHGSHTFIIRSDVHTVDECYTHNLMGTLTSSVYSHHRYGQLIRTPESRGQRRSDINITFHDTEGAAKGRALKLRHSINLDYALGLSVGYWRTRALSTKTVMWDPQTYIRTYYPLRRISRSLNENGGFEALACVGSLLTCRSAKPAMDSLRSTYTAFFSCMPITQCK